MKAIGHHEFGGPEVLEEVELPEPVPGPGQVRIRVRAAAVNPTDTLRRSGLRAEEMSGQGKPYVPGMDLAGILEDIGPNTDTDLSVGDHVMGILFPQGSHGAYSEQVVLPAESVMRVPTGVEDAAAATLPMNGLTACMTLDMLELEPGQTIGVTGAAGTYGGYVVQLAKAKGLRVVADAAEQDRDRVKACGADIVVARGDDVAGRFLQAVPGGVDGLADGAVLNERVVGAVRPGGRLVTVRHYQGDPVNGVTYHPVRVGPRVREQAKLDYLRRLVEEGKLALHVAAEYPAAQAAEAHRRLELGGTRGRLVLAFGD
jgi:NADPH:quinone reductase